MSVIATILLDAASGLAVPFVKRILKDKFGGTGGDVAGDFIDVVADRLGVPSEQIPEVVANDRAQVERVLVESEPDAVALWSEYVASQRLLNETVAGERDKGGPVWTWAWRPAGMWAFIAMTIWLVVFVPLLNAYLSEGIALVLDIATFVTLFVTYLGLYMGGHTVKDVAGKWSRK